MSDVSCSRCGKGMDWGWEYYPDGTDDPDRALCPHCYRS